MKQKLLLYLIFLLLSVGGIMAQNIQVKGKILDEKKDPVIGATIRLKGDAKTGATSNSKGEFLLKVPSNSTLIISYVGYKTLEIKATNSMNISLEPDAELLDEVMVVGYGTSTKRSFTGSAVTVNQEALQKKSVSNIGAALNGEIPGVNVINSSGQPGTSSSIYIRGIGSVNGSTGPLYVVDGIPFSGSISSLNPADIESTTLLKDAAATSIYGSRGANGVILITTRKGKKGTFSVSGEVKYGVNTAGLIPRHEVISDPEEYLEISFDALKTAYTEIQPKSSSHDLAIKSIFNPKNGGINPIYNYYKVDASGIFDENGKVRPNLERRYTPERWLDYGLQDSYRTEANVQMTGGTDKIKGFTSIGYLNDIGVSPQSSYKRFSGRTNIDLTPSNWFQVKTSLSYTHTQSKAAAQSDDSSGNLFYYMDNMPPIYPVFEHDKNGDRIPSPYFNGRYVYDFGEKRGFSPQSNPIMQAMYNRDYSASDRTSFNSTAILRFWDGFSFENTFAGDYIHSQSTEVGNKFYGEDAPGGDL